MNFRYYANFKDHGMALSSTHGIKVNSSIRHTIRKVHLPVLEGASQCQTKKQKSPQ